jgi:hypothetical protein
MTLAKDDLIEALRLRYDHYSALSVFELARERSGLPDKPTYDTAELRAWRDALSKVGDRVGKVLSRVDEMLEAEPAPAPEPKSARADKPSKAARPEPVASEAPKPVAAAARPAPAAPTTDQPATMETTIVLRGVKIDDGDQVLVCGTGEDLGDWDPERARPMVRSGDEWRAVVTVDARSPLAFKFMRRAPDGKITWEGGDNRELPVAPRIEATWR